MYLLRREDWKNDLKFKRFEGNGLVGSVPKNPCELGIAIPNAQPTNIPLATPFTAFEAQGVFNSDIFVSLLWSVMYLFSFS